MTRRAKVRFVQLPIPQATALCGTGNVPLAAGCLAVAARRGPAADLVDVATLPPEETDALGDALLAERVGRAEPDVLGLSLYLWNAERSLALARAVKRISPRTRVLVGGPEVGADNPYVLAQEGWDVAVAGEAEASIGEVLARFARGADVEGLPGTSVRRDGVASPFVAAPPADFPLTDYPSPYVDGALPVDAARSVYVETVRGCRSQCTFCFYPRAGGTLRALDPEASARLVADVAARGARDVVFLDPTFNHRPGFDELLDRLAVVNRDRSLTFFAEVRAEGLTEAHADKLAAAGFTKVEIGLQSTNPRTLKITKRGGDPAKVAAAARMLRARGVRLLVDLIIGLPGDAPADVAHGVEFLKAEGLGDDAQVFPLSLLPGTAMRADAARDGVVFDPAPPYRVVSTPLFGPGAIRAALFDAEERLGRRLDETPRPLLVARDPRATPPDVFEIDCDRPDDDAVARASAGAAQHVALWFSGSDLFAARDLVLRVVDARLAADPYAVLDVVLAPTRPFPLDLIDLLRRGFADAAPSYLVRAFALRGEDGARRVAIVLREGVRVPKDWGLAAAEEAPVFRDQSFVEALAAAELHGEGRPGARVVGPPPDAGGLAALFERADPDAVVFADRASERRWLARMLGHRSDEI